MANQAKKMTPTLPDFSESEKQQKIAALAYGGDVGCGSVGLPTQETGHTVNNRGARTFLFYGSDTGTRSIAQRA